ncbi:23S rRNA (pseudouridine(1915)-N(3))-methyltransferase RlmH [Azospirillum rugosum]|uniref:Ribosomal RNA large subunit methyltransferase H n=1 Tax=Azospirillum rugosum TaxID=416170 RepID=A0ABS4SRP5_9PROT|nr:23S rRNA (pseudouridine(1915)-N(3))-methyltransferase RlmH [Azospirillum rugosum]MBP2295229.1 23S rRNA (pseudouridine1915-N3)-methyltransferase [Azospirillum rugosum]MDQ0528603.1 23S rRNA (pseudouridine1915-N3)-methyltransferase [Azospirillum rugosum]
MRLWLAAVGRSRTGPARDLYDEYAGRLSWPLTLREVEVKKRLPPDEMKRQEAELLLAAIPAGSIVVALDERGKSLSSEAFAGRIGAWRDQGAADIAFLIGGADGHGDAVRARADFLLALGLMTWPHMLVRGMLAEQLYRAQQILAGHPYHRA